MQPTQRKLNEEVLAKYGKTLGEMLRDSNYNMGPVLEWLKRKYSTLPSREYGRAMALIRQQLGG